MKNHNKHINIDKTFKNIDNPQTYTVDNIVSTLNVDQNNGLDDNKVKENQEKYGKNILEQKKKKPIFLVFLMQFKEVMTIILLIAAIISFIPLIVNKNSQIAEWVQPFVILLIVLLNAIIGTIQCVKADKAVESLKQMSETQAKVIRNGITLTIPSSQVVVGDIIDFESGDKISADARLIECNNLKVIESSLTGESLAVEKNDATIWKNDTPLGDRINMVYSSSMVVYGSGKAIVTNVGKNTEIGHIASMIQEHKPEKTLLQKQIAKFSKWLSICCVILCFIVLSLQIAKTWSLIEINPINIIGPIMVAVSLAVAVIPEGLPIAITIIMSIGVTRMAKENAIVKNLSAIETLGSASIICSDKTGTLTQNKMTLVHVFDIKNNAEHVVSTKMDEESKKILEYGTLCCSASYSKTNDSENFTGDPTEIAIIRALNDLNISQAEINKKYPQIHEIAFDSNRKLMSTINKFNDKYLIVTKGAIDQLVEKSNNSKQEIDNLLKKNNQLSSEGERIIGIAYKIIDKLPKIIDSKTIENDLSIMGLVSMIDPIRENAKVSIQECIKGGIKVIMITGDHVVTAKKIGKDLGIFNEGDYAITGAELDKMNDNEFMQKIEKISIYARVSPENKFRIVKMWQSLNKIVAMTGDGVNDAPALKQAQIGCAMGITGTDVSKDAADIILADDNFSTIVESVKQGRNVFNNILKVINFLLATNIGEVISIIAILLISWKNDVVVEPLNAIQILWINLLTDSPPAIALGLEPMSRNIMLDKPRNPKQGILANGLLIKIALESLLIGVVMTIAFYIGLTTFKDTPKAQSAGSTMAFITLFFAQMVQIFSLKSKYSIFKTKIFNNKLLIYTTLIATGLTSIVSFASPIAENGFKMMTFYDEHWYLYLYILLLSIVVPFIYFESEKKLLLMHSKRQNVIHETRTKILD